MYKYIVHPMYKYTQASVDVLATNSKQGHITTPRAVLSTTNLGLPSGEIKDKEIGIN